MGVEPVKYALESVNNELCSDPARKKSWSIDKKFQEKTLTTIFGDVHYQRTYFVSKFGRGYSHICDRIFGIEPHERCDMGVKAKMIENAIDMSYEKSSNVFESKLSKQTVLNSIREMENERLSIESPKVKIVLDRYHLNKYIISATGNVPEMRGDIWRSIHKKDLKAVKDVFNDIRICADTLQRVEQINSTWQYIKNNWGGIKNSYDAKYIGCSAEGHISHILSERLSSGSLGWSYTGVGDMAKLRAFRANNRKLR